MRVLMEPCEVTRVIVSLFACALLLGLRVIGRCL